MPRRVNGALLILLATSAPVSAQVSKRAPNAQVSPSVRQFHTQMLTLDTHLDTPAVFGVTGWSIRDRHDFSRDASQVDLPRLKEGGLDGGFWAIYTPHGPRTPRGDREARDFALRRALQIREMVAANSDSFDLALEADDAPRIEDARDYPKITARLLAKGLSLDDVQKVWSGNVLRVLRAAEAHARLGPTPAASAHK